MPNPNNVLRDPQAKGGNTECFVDSLGYTGFAHLGSYGGLTKTPNMDALAADGLRYNNFHTTALCSPSRASLMAARNPHKIGFGSHALSAMGFPGYNGVNHESPQKSLAKDFQHAGFTTYALGKWDHTPLMEVSKTVPLIAGLVAEALIIFMVLWPRMRMTIAHCFGRIIAPPKIGWVSPATI